MSTITVERITPADIPATPGGLWADLARQVDAPALGSGDIWRGLERHLTLDKTPEATQLWETLGERIDPAQYRPQAVPDVAEEAVREDEQLLTVLRSPRGHYLRLTETQRDVWHQMDGTHTVAQLATQAFLTHRQLLPVGDLVNSLRDEGFLTDRPVGIYRSIAANLEDRTPEGWGRRILRMLTGQTWQIQHIDGVYGAIYQGFGRIFFTRVFFGIWVLVALAGLGAFIGLLIDPGRREFFSASGILPLELAGLWFALLISFLLHESAHALAVKHYGRNLRSGGAMLYFGAPAFFVDTSDIWRSPRRARIIVSAAGPMSDLFIGALAALLVWQSPDAAISAIAYKLAFTCYIATLFNINPLLELDGYYILVDLLRLPDLRRRALAFIGGPFWQKFGIQRNQGRRTFQIGTFSSEERIFALYGVLTLAYSLVAINFALQFWNRQLIGTIRTLWASGSLPSQVIAALLVLLVVAPIIAGVILAIYGMGRVALAWVIRHGYGRQPALLAGVAVLATLGLALLAARSDGAEQVLGPILWLVALGAILAVRPDYQGAASAPALNALLLTTLFAALASGTRWLGLDGRIWITADGLAFVCLLLAAFATLPDVELRFAPPRELLGTALLLMLAFGVGGFALIEAERVWVGASMLFHIAAAAPAYFGALALALLLPRLFDLRDSRLIWSWALLWGATLAQTAGYVRDLGGAERHLDALAGGLWAAAWLIHLATLRQIAPDEIQWPHEPSLSDTQRLARALQFTYAGCYRLLRAVYGLRRARAFDDRMDVLAATANWDVTLDRDRARIGAKVLELPIDQQGERYAEVLRYMVQAIEEITGAMFARRAIQAAYDALPWPERETASRLCFPDTPWAAALSRRFGDTRNGRLRLLRQVDLFLNCDDEELEALARIIQEQRVLAGTTVLQAGGLAPGVWIIEAGEVIARQDDQEINELHRGDSFGAPELIQQRPVALSYQATVGAVLLFLPAAEFRALTRNNAPHAAEALEAAEMLQLLERVPLFADLPRTILRNLGVITQIRHIEARTLIVRQGIPSGVFYIIKQGQAVVLVRNEPHGDQPARIRQIGRLGPREFFGELELLRGTPPVANVMAATPMVVLALPHPAIKALLLGDGSMARNLEEIGTGRLIALRTTSSSG